MVIAAVMVFAAGIDYRYVAGVCLATAAGALRPARVLGVSAGSG